MTDLFAVPYAEVIGFPIRQSKSPLIHNFWLQKAGIKAEYRAVQVRGNALADYIAERRDDPHWRGCNVTLPHKQAALALVDNRLRTAERVGAVNCIYRTPKGITGENSDVDGVLESLAAGGRDRDPGIVCLIGAGGAARAAMYALDVAGVHDLRVLVRRPERGQELLASFGMAGSVYRFGDADAAMAGANTVINASPLGMLAEQPMSAGMLGALAAAASDALVFDMVYNPLETPLLATARAGGRRVVDGLTMLIGQADLAFQLFFQVPAPRQHDAELRAMLTA